MLSKENLGRFTKSLQTSTDNVVREYCQHLFLSYLYQNIGSEKLLFKGGTALRIVYHSPRFSEDLDFTGVNITTTQVERLFIDTLAMVEKNNIAVELNEGKATSGGYIGMATFTVYDMKVDICIEVSLRNEKKKIIGNRVLIINDYIPAYTLVHMPDEQLVSGKLAALLDRHKPRDFYDFFFLLSGNSQQVRETAILKKVQTMVQKSEINFQYELKKFLPASHSMHLRDFKMVLEQKINSYLG